MARPERWTVPRVKTSSTLAVLEELRLGDLVSSGITVDDTSTLKVGSDTAGLLSLARGSTLTIDGGTVEAAGAVLYVFGGEATFSNTATASFKRIELGTDPTAAAFFPEMVIEDTGTFVEAEVATIGSQGPALVKVKDGGLLRVNNQLTVTDLGGVFIDSAAQLVSGPATVFGNTFINVFDPLETTTWTVNGDLTVEGTGRLSYRGILDVDGTLTVGENAVADNGGTVTAGDRRL